MTEKTCLHFMGYSFRLTAKDILCVLSHRHDSTYHGLYYTSCEALAGTTNTYGFNHIVGVFGMRIQVVYTSYGSILENALSKTNS